MSDNITQPQERTDVINTLVNPDWNKASSSWMAVGLATIFYAVVEPCVEVLYIMGVGLIVLSFIAYKAGKKNNGGS